MASTRSVVMSATMTSSARRADLARRQAQAEAAALTVTPLSAKQLLQFAGLEHLADDVAAADELALDVELRESSASSNRS